MKAALADARSAGTGSRSRARIAEKRLRVVVVTAAVGEGHTAAARALASDLLVTHDDTHVVICDALAGLGPLLRLILLDAYRWQLRGELANAVRRLAIDQEFLADRARAARTIARRFSAASSAEVLFALAPESAHRRRPKGEEPP